jgi:hypothetical protein
MAKTESELLVPKASEFYPRIEPGEYDAICYKVDIALAYGGRRNIYLRFRINGGEYDGTELFMACSFPKRKLTPNFKYYKQWMLAACRPPYPKERLSRKIFKNRLFRILVRDTRCRFATGKACPDYMQYSVIDSIIEPLTGCFPS